MPVYYPKLIVAGREYCSDVTGNCDEDPNPASEYIGWLSPRPTCSTTATASSTPSYRMTLVINSVLGEYYGVQGTTWQNPPILNNPTDDADGRRQAC